MFKQIIGGVLVLAGLAMVGFGFWVAYSKNDPGWAIGGFIAGAIIVGSGVELGQK